MSANLLQPQSASGPGRLSDEEWNRIAHLFPVGKTNRGRPRVDARAILDAVIWACFDGHKWSRLPSTYPSQQTCYLHFLKWRRAGVLTQVAQELGMPYEALCAMPPRS